MSRCFPYPPRGYTLSRPSEEALIESIKLQNEREKAKEQMKKEKRREKKEKRKEKKEREEENKHRAHQNLEKFDVVHAHGGKNFWADTKDEFVDKGSKAESEQLERSNLTEEQGQPVCLRLPSTSSDSTENSNKRKRYPSPVDANRGPGKIRLRLPLKKHNQSDAPTNGQNLCSTSGSTHFPPQDNVDIRVRQRSENVCCTLEGTSNISYGPAFRIDGKQICSTSKQNESVGTVRTTPSTTNVVGTRNIGQGPAFRNRGKQICSTSQQNETFAAVEPAIPSAANAEGIANTGQALALRIHGKQICSTSQQNETLAAVKTVTPSATNAVMTKKQRMKLKYKNLIENWVPPQLQDALNEPDDLDWLFQGKKYQESHVQKRRTAGDDSMTCSTSSLLCPRAQYLQEVDVYALPFTVPY